MPPTLRWRDHGLRFIVGGAAVVPRPQLSCVRVPGTPRAQTFGFPLGLNHQRGLSHQTGLAAIAKGSEIRIGLPTTRGHQRGLQPSNCFTSHPQPPEGQTIELPHQPKVPALGYFIYQRLSLSSLLSNTLQAWVLGQGWLQATSQASVAC